MTQTGLYNTYFGSGIFHSPSKSVAEAVNLTCTQSLFTNIRYGLNAQGRSFILP